MHGRSALLRTGRVLRPRRILDRVRPGSCDCPGRTTDGRISGHVRPPADGATHGAAGVRQHRGDRSAHESPGRCRVDTATPRNRDSHGPDADQEDSVDYALADEHAALRKMLRSFFEEEAPTHVIAELD